MIQIPESWQAWFEVVGRRICECIVKIQRVGRYFMTEDITGEISEGLNREESPAEEIYYK